MAVTCPVCTHPEHLYGQCWANTEPDPFANRVACGCTVDLADLKLRSTDTLFAAMADVAAERGRQEARWGFQPMPDTDGREDGSFLLGRPYAALANMIRAHCDLLDNDHRNHAVVLLEEVFEAMEQASAGDNPEALYRELTQVAALAVKWMQQIKLRGTT